MRRVGVKPTRAPSFATAAFGDADASDSGPDSSSPSSSSSSSSVSFGDLATIHPKVQLALARLGFHAPTFIQTQALPLITAGGDVVVAAETGSGKTLAYLVPIFSSLLWNGHGVDGDVNGVSSDAEGKNNQRGKVGALILAPNAVLVNQVAQVANLLVGENGEPLLKVAALTPDKALPIRFTPDIIVATPARAVEDVCRFSEGAWRRGGFSKHVPYIRHVVFDEADQLLSGGYLKPVRGIFDVLYREEKLAALGLTVEQSDDSNDESSQTDNTAQGGWSADAGRTPDSPAYEKDWRDDHKEDVAKLKKQISKQGQGPALGGKGLVGLGAGREFRRQYVFAAATVMSNGKKTPGAMIKYGFPDANWITGERLHRAVATVTQSWVAVTDVSPEDRQHVLAKFKTNEVDVLVCTDAAARGVDVPEVAHVVQAEFAGNAVEYLHRIGRTARCGAVGCVTNLIGAGDEELVLAVRKCEEAGVSVESAFSRKRSFKKKFKKYGETRTAPQNRG